MVVWEKVADGEFGEHKATINGRSVTIYSNRSGDEWNASVDDGESFSLEADNRDDAQREIEAEVALWK